MDNKSQLQRIEELSMNALPAIQTQIFDGWILRFSNGYTKRANSINPIYFSSENLKSKIKNSEQMYRERNLPVIYKMTPNVCPKDLDNALEKSGYIPDSLTSVQVLPIKEIEVPPVNNVEVYNKLHKKWFANFCAFNKIRKNDQRSLKIMLNNIISKTCFILLTDDDKKVLACGLGVLQGEYIGLFDIVTNEKYRNKGYGKVLILNILHWGKKNGAKKAYLQVVVNNTPALNLYSSLGFEEKYRYWYRIKK